MEYSDFSLVRGIKSGDKHALDLLVRRWYPQIYGYVFKLIRHEQDAYDITQDSFVAMMLNIQSYRPWNKFDSWLFTIAHNKCMDYFRSQKRLLAEDPIPADQPSPGPLLDELVSDSLSVHEALHQLPALQREAVVLHYFYQFTAREIAHMTSTPLPTIKSRLAAAKKTLAICLGEGFK